ncbi:putative hydrolase [Nostocoides australiense Ben110]|uniref:Putative hydrolase n=1 Tax=Nostocoides australiense Ben110 TaxID=1193182 RepID=W6JU64_9MICO|nr:MBL fold metallo-hydrolase [Tetrasphaera australiensis]CCH72056.1 putative hydrolase [Tetrasphaera australiensis Ben110]
MSSEAGRAEVVATSPGGVRVERVITSGIFALDGGEWEVDNNVWIVGDDAECFVIDAAHDAAAILAAVGDRSVRAVLCTHAHNDHITAAPAVREATGAPIALHPADQVLWELTYPRTEPDEQLADGESLSIGDVELEVLHTPGHAPGAVCLYAASLGLVFTGDTLFQGGPGATGRSYSDKPTILASIRDSLLVLPPETVVLTGHGDSSTIGAEATGSDFA